MNKYSLDNRDKAILQVLCNNARLSYNQIGKITHISKDSVRDRILRMQKERFILSYFPLINYPSLRLHLFNVYCRLKSIKYVSKNQIKTLIANPHISSVTWLMGKFDLELQIMAKNKREVKKVLIKSKFLNKIEDYKITLSGNPEIYSTTHLGSNMLNDEKQSNDSILNKKDIQLIDLLCINARERTIDLADKLDLKEDEVRYRLKKLVKNNIILAFHARTNKTFIGLTRYLTLIKVKNSLNEHEISSLKNMSNIFYLKRCKGSWNYVIRFHTASDQELVNTFSSLREVFSKNLIDFKVHTILDISKFNPSPKFLLKESFK